MEKLTFESVFKDSDFINKEVIKKEPVLTMAFVNMQPITDIYSVDEALKNGTLFKNIDKPLIRSKTYVK